MSKRRHMDLVDLDAEREVLGAVFVRPELLPEITLGAEDFGVGRHRLIWAGIQDAAANGMQLDLGSVAHVMRRAGTYEQAGGMQALSECLDRQGYSWNAVHYAGVIRSRALERRMLDVQGELGSAIARNEQDAVAQHLDALQLLSREHAQMGAEIDLRTIDERANEGNWFEDVPPEARVLLRNGGAPFMRDGRVALLVASGSTGKTYALCDLGLAIGCGGDWLETYRVERKGRVCLGLGEEDAEEGRRRIYRASRRLDAYQRSEAARNVVVLGLAGQEVGLLRKGQDGNIVASAWFESFRANLARMGEWRAIILDPWSRWGGPDAETDAHAATRGVQLLEALTKLPGNPAVIVAHHTRKPMQVKGGGSAPDVADTRGSSALVDGARLVVQMMRRRGSKRGLLDMVVTKANYTVPGDPLVLSRGTHGVLRPATPAEMEDEQ